MFRTDPLKVAQNQDALLLFKVAYFAHGEILANICTVMQDDALSYKSEDWFCVNVPKKLCSLRRISSAILEEFSIKISSVLSKGSENER